MPSLELQYYLPKSKSVAKYRNVNNDFWVVEELIFFWNIDNVVERI